MDVPSRLVLVGLAMTLPVLLVGGTTIGLLYDTAFQEQRERLVETAKSQARLIESVSRFGASTYATHPLGIEGAIISQVAEAHKNYKGFGKTGEFAMARQEGENIVFLLSHRHFDLDSPLPVPINSQLAEPMRRALSGKSGIIIGLDYRGEKVLAAFEPVAVLNVGLVAKIDLAEIQQPFIRAGMIVLGIALIAVLMGTWLFLGIFRYLNRLLAESEMQARSVLNATSNGMMILDDNGKLISLNQAAEDLLGYSAQELTGRTLEAMISPEKIENQAFFMNWLPTSNGPHDSGLPHELLVTCRNGNTISVELTLSDLIIKGNHQVLCTFWNITERREAEALKDEFISTLSHELRTPVTSIMGSLGIIQGLYKDELSPEIYGLLEITQRNSQILIKLINDLLDIQKIEAGGIALDQRILDMSDLVAYAVAINGSYAEKFHVLLKVKDKSMGRRVFGDWDRLTQVLSNLISNAVKHSPPNKSVEISLLLEGQDQVRVMISDKGKGVPEEFRPRIFGKFSQADSSDSRHKGGTGLGLSISKTIIETHGGKIDYVSTDNKGASFYFDLPLADHRMDNISGVNR